MPTAARMRLLLFQAIRITAAAGLAAVLLTLPFLGRLLTATDPLQPSDAIVVLAGARLERWLEARDLYKEGWAPIILLSPGPLSDLEQELRTKGLRYPLEGDLARDGLLSLGVPAAAVVVLPGGVDNTAAEAALFRRTHSPGPHRRIIVVTSSYHTRRAGFAFRRALEGTGVEIIVRASRYTSARPGRWWTQRADTRFILSELPKLLAYVVGLGE